MSDPQYIYDIDYELYYETDAGTSAIRFGLVVIAGSAPEAIRQLDACARDTAEAEKWAYRGHKVLSAGVFVHDEVGQDHPSVIGKSYFRGKA